MMWNVADVVSFALARAGAGCPGNWGGHAVSDRGRAKISGTGSCTGGIEVNQKVFGRSELTAVRRRAFSCGVGYAEVGGGVAAAAAVVRGGAAAGVVAAACTAVGGFVAVANIEVILDFFRFFQVISGLERIRLYIEVWQSQQCVWRVATAEEINNTVVVLALG